MNESMSELLKQIPLFSDLGERELEALQTITSTQTYRKRENIFLQGAPREAVYFLYRGLVKTFKVDKEGNEQIIHFLQPGEMFPHVGFFEKTPYPATAQVMEETMVYAIRIQDFDQLMLTYPSIAVKVMKVMGQKLSALTERIQEVTSRDVRNRVILTLIRLAYESGYTNHQNEAYIQMPLRNSDLANLVGSSRESVSRVLNELKKNELIQVERSSIQILNMVDLKSYSSI